MIIQCPECGGHVSDKAQVCVHCGYRFRVCPDCGKILADNESMCPSCGHIFSADMAHETAAPSQKSSVPSRSTAPVTPYALWMHDDAKARILNKALTVGKWGLFSVGVILVVAALIVYFSWVGTSELEKIFTAQKTQSTLAVLGTIGIILADITAFEQLQNVMRWEMGAVWLRRAKIPAEEMLAECGKVNDQRKGITDKEMAQFNDSVSMTYLAAYPQKTILLVVGLIIQFILWIAVAVLSGFWMQDVTSYFVLKELDPELVSPDKAIVYFVAISLIWIIGGIVKVTFHAVFSKGQDRWFNFIVKNRSLKV